VDSGYDPRELFIGCPELDWKDVCPYYQLLFCDVDSIADCNVELLVWIQQGSKFPCGVVYRERPCRYRGGYSSDICTI
jgi:hypothetical protein